MDENSKQGERDKISPESGSCRNLGFYPKCYGKPLAMGPILSPAWAPNPLFLARLSMVLLLSVPQTRFALHHAFAAASASYLQMSTISLFRSLSQEAFSDHQMRLRFFVTGFQDRFCLVIPFHRPRHQWSTHFTI